LWDEFAAAGYATHVSNDVCYPSELQDWWGREERPHAPNISDHPLLEQRSQDNIELLVFTSDRGLCGGFNSNINRKTEQYAAENQDKHSSISLDIIGRKGREYFRRRDLPTNRYFQDILTDVSLTRCAEIAEHVITNYTEKNLDAVYCVYNEFKSAITQEVVVEQLLPVVPVQNDDASMGEFIYEPSKEEIMDAVLPRHITVQIYRMMLESVASEMGARMSAMDAATKNAGELIDRLTLQYNRARQAAITTELMEIIGGAEALKG